LTAVLFLAVLAVYAGIYLASGARDPGVADGHYSFLYARSIVFDGDLDFRNDYAICGDVYEQGIDRGTGHVDNPAYSGPALVWIPLLAAARAVVPLAADADAAERAGCRGPLARAALVVALPLGALAIAASYRAARRFAETGAALVAAVLFAVASSLPQYASVFVSSSHVFECAFAALCLWLSLRAAEDDEWRFRPWALVGLSLFALTLQRLPDACLAVVPLTLLVRSTMPHRRKLASAALVLGGPALAFAAVGTLYTYLYGSPWVLPQGRYFIHAAHAHPFLLLFAPQGGLLYVTPSAYLAFAGIVVAISDARHRWFAVSAAVVVAITLWVASSPLDWHAKATFGARRLVVLTPLFVVLAARALQVAFARVPRDLSRVVAAEAVVVATALGVPALGAVRRTTTGWTPLVEAPLHAHEAGRAYRAVAAFGDVAILPAKVLYALRFRMPMDSFGAATTNLFYRRSYRDLHWEPQTLVFESAALRAASRGMEPRGAGLALRAADAAVVFTAGWPYADAARLDVDAAGSGPLAMSIATAFHRCELGEQRLEHGRNIVRYTIPQGCFDSGLVEIGCRSAPEGRVEIVQLTVDAGRALPPPF
jgi:hypothetical protein